MKSSAVRRSPGQTWRIVGPGGSSMALTFCVLLLSGVVQAQDGADDVSASDAVTAPRVEVEGPRGDAIDEILVTGTRNLRNLMAMAERLTLDFYGLLNDAIDDPEFRITCAYESSAGTRIRRQVCRPRYVANEQSIVAQQEFRQRLDFEMAGDDVLFAPGDFDAADARVGPRWDMQLEFNDRILQAVNEDPALNRAFWELYALKEEIDELRARD